MKKILIAVVLILALCLTLAACGEKTAPKPTDAPAVPTEAPADAPAAPGSIGEKLASYGFKETDFVVHSQDYVAFDEDGDIVLYSTAPYEDVARACYDACAKAADDGLVRDFWTEEPTDFTFAEEEMSMFGYMRGGEFKDLAVSPFWTDEDTGYTEYLLQWD